MKFWPGQVLKGRYRITGSLGRGGFGRVYRAWDLQFRERSVAVKQRVPIDPADKREEELFLREAQFLSDLRHPGIPEIYDSFVEQSFQFIVMQFIEGKNLEEVLKEKGGMLQEAEALTLMKQVATILEYLHSLPSPLIHRDLKPENIILCADGKVYLVDFGTSRHFNPSKARDTVRIGTSGYMAPEQFQARSVPQSDLFSFGASFHHLLSGIDPREKEGSDLYLFPSLQKINSTVSHDLDSLILNCIKEDPSMRIKSAADILPVLHKLQERYQASALPQAESCDPQFWLHRGKYHMEGKDHKKALECLVKARKLGLGTSEVISLIARCHRKIGNKEKARTILGNLLQSAPADEELAIEYCRSVENPADEEKVLMEFLKDHPSWDGLRLHWIQHLLRTHRTVEAEIEIEEALKKRPGDIRLVQQKAALLFERGRIEELEGFLEIAALKMGDHPDILFRSGYAKELLGKDSEAFALYKKASAKEGHADAELHMARLLAKQRSLSDAREHYIKAALLKKDNLAIKSELGCFLCREGFHDQAVPYLREVLHFTPDEAGVLKHLGLALGELKEYNEAVLHLESYLRLVPEERAITVIIGRYLSLAGKYQEARTLLEDCCRQCPEDRSAAELLEQVEKKQGKVPEI
ncbi:MAG: protein kinase [Candidatus Eremiobacteraeota bacterium]|nr:protein kinase [Candidatus Eremiobacteraeota bacterium]